MDQTANYLPYHSTGYFSKIVTDYLSGSPKLRPFYDQLPDLDGIQKSIAARKAFATPRKLLVDALEKQYEGVAASDKVRQNIRSLTNEHTFTITTAHQPNIFTGPLYFIYKIMHVIRLADELKQQLPGKHFVPVYYMGSEDADLDELGFIHVGGQKLVWETKQTGAVGRMKVDKALVKLIHSIHGQTGVLAFGTELHGLFTQCYTEGKSIQQATLELVTALFNEYGLVVLIPDSPALKTAYRSVVEKELKEGFSHKIVSNTIDQLGKEYKVQAGGREINLFYLLNDKRERIELVAEKYKVHELGLSFSQAEILEELSSHPERFSANVILRGGFQETILPNIAFIGGGGELAYWLELKDIFEAVAIPYPVLILRNSFLLMKQEQADRIQQLGFSVEEMFGEEQQLLNTLVKRESSNQLDISKELEQAHEFYGRLKKISASVDKSLEEHVTALETKAVKKLAALEKKLVRSERSKYQAQQQQISKLKQALFPGNSLQERVDNFSLYYAKEGQAWLDKIYNASTGFNKGFGIVVSPL